MEKTGAAGAVSKTGAGLGGVASSLAAKADILLVSAIVVLAVVVLVYFGLFGYRIYLEQEMARLNLNLEELQSQRDPELEEDLANLIIGIEALKQILNERIYSSRLFVMLEELTLPQIRFSGLNVDFKTGGLKLQTEASDYSTLAQQVFVFGQDERVKSAELFGAQLEEGGRVKSEISLELDTGFLRYDE